MRHPKIDSTKIKMRQIIWWK